MQAKVEWVEKVQFQATGSSGHCVSLDGPSDAGGTNAGSRPMELMLMGVGGCTAYDVITILAKSRQTVSTCTAEISAVRSDGVPAVFESIHIHFRLSGENLDESKVARAISLSADKYCSASIMLARAGVAMSHDYTIEESQSD
ncbi:MAG: OsmC family protein [Pseudomonadales bacterium]